MATFSPESYFCAMEYEWHVRCPAAEEVVEWMRDRYPGQKWESLPFPDDPAHPISFAELAEAYGTNWDRIVFRVKEEFQWPTRLIRSSSSP